VFSVSMANKGVRREQTGKQKESVGRFSWRLGETAEARSSHSKIARKEYDVNIYSYGKSWSPGVVERGGVSH